MRRGQVLGERYKLSERLGQGGMGEVWKGRDQRLDRDIAVKVLIADLVSDPEMIARFEREARIAAGLHHPGITVVFDMGRHEKHLYFVMELLKGQDLGGLLAAQPDGLSAERSISIAAQVADALAEAHNHGVVHRDIKPANLMVLAKDRVKVCDFGIALFSAATTRLTSTGVLMGTVTYMSPEQCKAEPADSRTDLYSLGCVLHEMLTGQPPFPPGQPPHVIMFQHIQANPPSMRTARPGIPEELDRLVLELLAKDPADRPGGAADVAERLRSIATGALTHPATVRPFPERAARREHRRKASPAARPPDSARAQELRGMITSPVATIYDRIRAAGELAMLDPAFQAEGAAYLNAVLDDGHEDGGVRVHAANALVKLQGRESAAVATLTALMRDPDIDEDDRADAAAALARADPHAAEEALGVCYRYIVSDNGTALDKWPAAGALREHVPALAGRAAEILRRRAADSSVSALQRSFDIEVLSLLGDEHKSDAAALALRMLRDPRSGRDGVKYAAARLKDMGREYAQAAGDELEKVARNPRTPVRELVGIASTLQALGRGDAAVAAIRRAVADPGLGEWDLNWAGLILGRENRDEALAIYRRVLRSSAFIYARAEAARRMAWLGAEGEREGVAALRALAADPALGDDDLRRVAQQLAEIGAEYREEAEAMLRR